MNQFTSKPTANQPLSVEAIQSWLVSQFSEQLGVEPNDINTQLSFDSFGLDSAQGMLITTRAEKILGFRLSPTLFWHYPTIESLAQRLTEESKDAELEVFEI
ncbi:MAG: phosphopantetheine-binding protein [Brasilonema sp.]